MWYRQAKKHTTIMIAVHPRKAECNKLQLKKTAVEGLEPTETSELHLTLFIVGEASDFKSEKELIHRIVESFAASQEPLEGVISGVGYFNHEGSRGQAMYASVDSISLPQMRQDLLNAFSNAGIKIEQTHGFTPHITLGWHQNDEMEVYQVDRIPLHFDSISVTWNGDKTEYKMKG